MGLPAQKDSSVLVALIVTAMLVITGSAWLFLNDEERSDFEQESLVQTPADKSPIELLAGDQSGAVDKAIQMAELAFQAGQLAVPTEGSAVYFYRQVLSLEPTNLRAQTGMKLIATQLTDEAFEQIRKRNYEQAVTTLHLLNDIAPESDNVIAVRLSLVEKTQIMYAAMDAAISQRQFDRGEELARSLRVFPEVDAARISAALVAIATARNQPEVVRNVIGDFAEPVSQAGAPIAQPMPTELTGAESIGEPTGTEPSGTGVVSDAQTAQNDVAQALPTVVEIATEQPVSTTGQTMRAGEAVALDAAASAPAAAEVVRTRTEEERDTGFTTAATLAVTDVGTVAETSESLEINESLRVEEPETFVSPDTVALLAKQVAETIAIATERVASKQLMSPETDSAHHYYQRALGLDPGNPEAKRGLRSLVQTITAEALHKGKIGEWEAAEALLAQAQNVGYANNLVAQTRTEIKALRLVAEQGKFVSIDQFMVKKSVTPKYPRRAVSRSVEGWVTLEFVVDASGETRDIKVVDSSRQYASQFSKAAISAVEQWRFKPRIFEGQAISQRSKTTVQFKLTD